MYVTPGALQHHMQKERVPDIVLTLTAKKTQLLDGLYPGQLTRGDRKHNLFTQGLASFTAADTGTINE